MTGSLGYFAIRGSVADGQQLRKAELMPVRVSDVKEVLALGRICRGIGHQCLSLDLSDNARLRHRPGK